MKKISLLVPCYNERENIKRMAETLTDIMNQYEGKYEYEIIFRDNDSTDGSQSIYRELIKENSRIKAIINARNYGIDPAKDSFIGRNNGDAIIFIPADFQEPPELIPKFIKYWEMGYEAVCGVKDSSQEGKFKYGLRQIFYRIIDSLSDIPQYKNMSGIVLVSRRIYEMKNETGRDMPYRFFLADIGCEVKQIHYEQKKRSYGKSSYNIWRYLSFAIDSMTRTSHVPLRLATVLGVIMSFASFVIGVMYLVLKLLYWNKFDAGIAPMLIGIFFLGSIQLLFIGIVGEYVGNVLQKVTPKNPVIVKELLNFEMKKEDPYLINVVSEVSKESES